MAQLQTEPVWRGSQDIREQPGSPDWEYAENVTVRRVFEGPIAALHAARPVRGAVMADLGEPGNNVFVQTVRIAPVDTAGKGRMTVILQGQEFGGSPGDPGFEPVTEIYWQAVTKDLRFHPNYQPGGNRELNTASRKAIEAALQDPEKPLPFAAGSSADHLYQRILRGFDSYTVYVPVVRRTTQTIVKPGGSSVGMIQSPPESPPGSWQYRKTADESVRRGTGAWERREEWTGADFWDTDTYQTAP